MAQPIIEIRISAHPLDEQPKELKEDGTYVYSEQALTELVRITKVVCSTPAIKAAVAEFDHDYRHLGIGTINVVQVR